MASAAQRDTERKVKETSFLACTRNEFLPKLCKGYSVMMCVKIDCLTLSATIAAFLASITIALEYSGSPSNILLGFTQYLMFLGYATLPVMGILAYTLTGSLNLSDQKLGSFSIMSRDKVGNTKTGTVHVGLDKDRSLTAALTKVLALICLNPDVYATIVRSAVISGIRFANRPTHAPYGIKFNRGLQCKWGELLETRTMRIEGNQQPSTVNGETLTVKVQRLADEEPTNKSATSAPRESDDIVHAHRNVGAHVNGLKFNSATITKSRCVPGSEIGTAGSQTNVIAVSMLKFMSGGAVVAYPTITTETFWWMNARKPYLNFYISDDPEFGFGFTGFKPAQGNTKVAGQCLASINMTGHPRYHAQLYGITG